MVWILGFCVVASLGLPGLAGFWGEFPAILSAYNPAAALNETLYRVYMVIAAIGTIFAAGYLLWLLQRVAFGTPKAEWEGHKIDDMHLTDYIAWTPILILIVVFGVYPNAIFHITDAAVMRSLRFIPN
jgi:NADH-quinone oxidoreductase subunit M